MATQRRTPRSRPADTEQPATAPLEAPQKSQTAPDAVEPVPTVMDTGVALIAAAVHPIIDQETGEAPELDGLFVKLAEHSTIRVCTKRLLEHEEGGVTKLLLCKGAQVSLDQAAGILTRLAEHVGAVVEAPVETEEVVETPEVTEPVEVKDADGNVVAVIEPEGDAEPEAEPTPAEEPKAKAPKGPKAA